MKRSIDGVAAGPILFALCLSPSVAAQDSPSSETVFTEILEVRVVNLEVVVEDKQGHRVTGLAPDDFQLLVDGEVLPIDYFTEIQGGQVAETGGGVGTFESVPGFKPGNRMGTSYLVFIDDYFTVGPSPSTNN